MADEKPIVIIKKKGGHGGHHGGAWKIAYADFVTAMMCFFLVMWLVNSAEVSTRQAIASYFRRPGLFSEGSGTPLLIGGSGILEDAYAPAKPKENKGSGTGQPQQSVSTPIATPEVRTTPPAQATPAPTTSGSSEGAQKGGPTEAEAKAAAEKAEFGQLAEMIKAEIAKSEELAKLLGIVDVKVEADGLNIEIMDTDKTSMFSSGSATILGEAREAFAKIAALIRPLPNKIDIVGHTDSKPFSSRIGGYSNWELSADRANAARKILEAAGIGPDRFSSVVGRSDRELKTKNGLDPSNRRITLKMRFNFTRKLDLSKDPNALKDIAKITEEPIIPGLPAPAPQAAAPTTAQTEQPVHQMPLEKPTSSAPTGFRPKKIFKAKKSENTKTVLPDEEEGESSSGTPGAFDSSPVISADPFASF